MANDHSDDPFDLQRFIAAQDDCHERALEEIRDGRKQSHWMWFVFPQLRGLGRSPMAHRFGIGSPAEARAYLAHPILGPRLIAAAEAVLSVDDASAHDIFGFPDDAKLQSSATLFAAQMPPGSVFHQVLERYFDGRRDQRTLDMLAAAGGGRHQ